jgi:lysophospholipase L1-like esterase
VLGRLPQRSGVVLCVLLGEIDVRAHLAVRAPEALAEFDFVGNYVARVRDLGAVVRSPKVVVVVPVPPTEEGAFNPDWPVRGSFAQRLGQFESLREALADGVAASPISGLVLLDLTAVLADPDGGLAARLTDDRVHLNAVGAAIVRRAMADLVAPPATS